MGTAKALRWLKQNRVSMAVDFLVQQNRPAQAFDDYEKKIWPKIKSVLKPCVGVYALAPRFWHRRCLNR